MIILSLTTVPARINDTLPMVLKSLSGLNYDAYEIHLNVPAVYSQTGEPYIIPDTLRHIDRLKIFDGLEDLGPKTKIIPTLKRAPNDAIIITADDDIIYHRNLISYHLERRAKYPDAALGFSGTKAGRLILTPQADTEVDILDNYKTASYTRSMFNDDFFSDYAEQSWNDDIVISAYLRDRGIKKLVVAYGAETFFVPRVKSFPIINVLHREMTGCDLIRGHANKSTSLELQMAYDAINRR